MIYREEDVTLGGHRWERLPGDVVKTACDLNKPLVSDKMHVRTYMYSRQYVRRSNIADRTTAKVFLSSIVEGHGEILHSQFY